MKYLSLLKLGGRAVVLPIHSVIYFVEKVLISLLFSL